MDKVYVTVLSNGDGYVPGVEALGRSLERSGTPYPKLALVTPDVPRAACEVLRALGWLVREVAPIETPNLEARPLFARFAHTFTKLRAFGLSDVKKAVLLDADTLVMHNVDELFERPSIAAAPDYLWPDRFNSGVIVLEPSADTLGRMLDALARAQSYDGGDQGFLNAFYGDWYLAPPAHRLPAGYNMHQYIYQFLHAYPHVLPELEREAKILHYSLQKPWRSTSTLVGGSAAWWEVFRGAHARPWERRLHALEDRVFERALRALLRPRSRRRS